LCLLLGRLCLGAQAQPGRPTDNTEAPAAPTCRPRRRGGLHGQLGQGPRMDVGEHAVISAG